VRPTSFVPTVEEISADRAGEIPGLEAEISHWTEGACSAVDWFREANAGWGTAGFFVRRGGDTSGFVVYGPIERLPHAGAYPVGPLGEDAVLLAYVAGDGRTRRRLLVRMLRDLKHRGVVRVEAIASDRGAAGSLSAGDGAAAARTRWRAPTWAAPSRWGSWRAPWSGG
jgi:hypothetical protein